VVAVLPLPPPAPLLTGIAQTEALEEPVFVGTSIVVFIAEESK